MSTATLGERERDRERERGQEAVSPPSAPEQSSRRGKRLVVAMLIASLLLTAVMRFGVHHLHDRLAYSDRPRPQNRLQGLNTFAMGLILGGLRGPLVMFLWTSSETQKTERNLEDFDTKIDLIRMLQPEFDSVHIFQIWNKGYNITVQAATMPNKYATILDALRYAKDVDAQRPDNVNIMVSMADLYFNKLGNSAEKKYYLARIREDSQWREQKVTGLARTRQTRHEVLLDPEGRLLPQFLKPKTSVAKTAATGSVAGMGYDGSDLQFLGSWNEEGGFPYGVSPLALGYNYYARASVLQKTTGRRHLYMTEAVVDSRVPIILKIWSDEEWDRARRAEARVAGKATPEDKFELEPVTASLKPGEIVDRSEGGRALLSEALFELRRASRLAAESKAHHERHMATSASLNTDYRSHADEAQTQSEYLAADHEYLSAVVKLAGLSDVANLAAGEPAALLKSARAKYAGVATKYYLHTLKYYVEDAVAAKAYPTVNGEKLTKATIQKADPAQYPAIFEATRKVLKEEGRWDVHADDAKEYETYAKRATERVKAIDGLVGG